MLKVSIPQPNNIQEKQCTHVWEASLVKKENNHIDYFDFFIFFKPTHKPTPPTAHKDRERKARPGKD